MWKSHKQLKRSEVRQSQQLRRERLQTYREGMINLFYKGKNPDFGQKEHMASFSTFGVYI